MKPLIVQNAWHQLRRFTPARIALGRVGDSLPTQAVLEFGLAHARARDAVHIPLDCETLIAQLKQDGFDIVAVRSAATDRSLYLRRPDLGRQLNEAGRTLLRQLVLPVKPDVAFMIGDGLSSCAVATHVVPLLKEIRSKLCGWKIAPVVVAEQARVALGDEVGYLLEAEVTVVLIGERPGLSSPDSLGIYLTYNPQPGRNDSERNCISNVRLEGLSYSVAAHKLYYLMTAARQLRLSGVGLKDESDLLP
ncbi:MAG: ethanolamine ammonia-lyase subunit EutC [Dissulfurispiraceae bacterium]